MAKNNKSGSRWAESQQQRIVNKKVAGSSPTSGYRGPDPREAEIRGTVRQRDVDKALSKIGGRSGKPAQSLIAKIKSGAITTRGGTIAKAVARGMLSPAVVADEFAARAARAGMEKREERMARKSATKRPVTKA